MHDLSRSRRAIEQIGGAPVVIKLLEGTQGLGVILAESTQGAESIVETLQVAAQQNALIQQFVHESRGRDIRAFVVGDRVVAAMRRIADGDEFRSNIHRGGRAEKVVLDAEYERTALHAAQILGLRVAGVDMLEGRDGPLVTEVNSLARPRGIELATSVDVAGAIVQLIEDEVLFPEIDIRQRLTIQSGYARDRDPGRAPLTARRQDAGREPAARSGRARADDSPRRGVAAQPARRPAHPGGRYAALFWRNARAQTRCDAGRGARARRALAEFREIARRGRVRVGQRARPSDIDLGPNAPDNGLRLFAKCR